MKHLIFYWYVNPQGWQQIYNLHLINLQKYVHNFDKVTFIISRDEDTPPQGIQYTIAVLSQICWKVKHFEFMEFENDKELREAKYFYEEIVKKLDSFDENEEIFFAHNKGVASIYVSNDELVDWINLMYFDNLHDIDKIEKAFEDGYLCCGTDRIENYAPQEFEWSRNKWIFCGTFFWIKPRELSRYLKDNDKEINTDVTRYYAEGFFGDVLPIEKSYSPHGNKLQNEHVRNYIKRTFTKEELEEYGKSIM